MGRRKVRWKTKKNILEKAFTYLKHGDNQSAETADTLLDRSKNLGSSDNANTPAKSVIDFATPKYIEMDYDSWISPERQSRTSLNYSQLPLYGIYSTMCATIICIVLGTYPWFEMWNCDAAGNDPHSVFSAYSAIFYSANAAQKIIAIMLGLCVAVSYVLSGMYGSAAQLGVGNAILIIFQLWFAGIIVICSDELLLKGYGMGPGMSLFSAASICGKIMWKAFSPMTVNSGQGVEFEGCVIALFHLLITRTDKTEALREAFAHSSLADMADNPFRALFYLVFVSSTCVWISKTWIRTSLTSPLDVAYQLARHMEARTSCLLFRYIPRVVALGGISIGALTVLADSGGAFS